MAFSTSLLLHVAVLVTLSAVTVTEPIESKPITLIASAADHYEHVDLSAEAITLAEHLAESSQPTNEAGGRGFVNEVLPATFSTEAPLQVLPSEAVGDFVMPGQQVDAIPEPAVLFREIKGIAGGHLDEGHGNDDDGGMGNSKFFGVSGKGASVVYVVDCSSSMIGPPLARLKQELSSAVAELPNGCRFGVVFFHSTAVLCDKRLDLRPATSPNRSKYLAWINTVEATGGTEPEQALEMALALRPANIFLMTDGVFSFPFDVKVMRHLSGAGTSRVRTKVHTIAFGPNAAEGPLKEIARQTGGQYHRVLQ